MLLLALYCTYCAPMTFLYTLHSSQVMLWGLKRAMSGYLVGTPIWKVLVTGFEMRQCFSNKSLCVNNISLWGGGTWIYKSKTGQISGKVCSQIKYAMVLYLLTFKIHSDLYFARQLFEEDINTCNGIVPFSILMFKILHLNLHFARQSLWSKQATFYRTQ